MKWYNELWRPQSDPRSWYNVEKNQRFVTLPEGPENIKVKTTGLVHSIILANC